MPILSKDMKICFAHAAYRLKEEYDRREGAFGNVEVRTGEELTRQVESADVLVVSGLWRNDLLDLAPNVRFIQSIGAGTDQFPKEELRRRGIRLASAQGSNMRAVAEHAIAHILAASRRMGEARDNQARHVWRPMIGDPAAREDELSGKVLLLVGLGGIGNRIAQLAKAFDMHVVAFRRDPDGGRGHADEVHGLARLKEMLPRADFVTLACPLTPETERLIDAEALSLMKTSAYLVNVARGRCVDEPALIEALAEGRIAGAGIDVTVEEPLPAASPLWDFPNAFITPHTGGETSRYEKNVVDILEENLGRLLRGEDALVNQIV